MNESALIIPLFEVSSPPRNASIQRVSNSMARVQWTEPTLPNGQILGYHIYVHNVAANLTKVEKFQLASFTQHSMEYSIQNLSTSHNLLYFPSITLISCCRTLHSLQSMDQSVHTTNGGRSESYTRVSYRCFRSIGPVYRESHLRRWSRTYGAVGSTWSILLQNRLLLCLLSFRTRLGYGFWGTRHQYSWNGYLARVRGK